MKRVHVIYSLLAGLVAFMSSCAAEFQTYNLSEEIAPSLHYPSGSSASSDNKEVEEESSKSNLVGVPAKSFYGGDLKRGAIWWASKDVSLEKGDFFSIYVSHIGADSVTNGTTNPAIDLPGTPFGATFPPLDLIKEPVILKISARAEGANGTEPILYLQVADADGYQANAKRPFNKIENSTEFKDYYFDMRDIYVQGVPKNHKVNGALINSLQFFINPGQEGGYTGSIFIKEIRVILAPPAMKP